MKNFNNELYLNVKESLNGKTLEEKLKDVKRRLFMNDMVDFWSEKNYQLDDVLEKLKLELEGALNGKQE